MAVLGALVAVALDNADALRDVDLDITWAWLIAAVPIGLAAGVVLPLGWRRLVAAYGVAISRGAAVRVWCLSQTGRYLPTGVAGFAARVVMASKEGVPRTLTSATLAIELGLLAAWSGLYRGRLHPVVGGRSAVAGPARRRVARGDRSAPARSSPSAAECSPRARAWRHTSSIDVRCTRRRSCTA